MCVRVGETPDGFARGGAWRSMFASVASPSRRLPAWSGISFRVWIASWMLGSPRRAGPSLRSTCARVRSVRAAKEHVELPSRMQCATSVQLPSRVFGFRCLSQASMSIILKTCVVKELLDQATQGLECEIKQLLDHEPTVEGVLSLFKSRLNWFDGIEDETKELKYIEKSVPFVAPISREMASPQVSTDAEGFTALQPRVSRPRIAYDFKITDLLARLLQHDAKARQQIYDTLVTWNTKPELIPGSKSAVRVVADVIHGRVFLEHEWLGLAARVTREEAEAASADAPLKIAIIVWGDAFKVHTPNVFVSFSVLFHCILVMTCG